MRKKLFILILLIILLSVSTIKAQQIGEYFDEFAEINQTDGEIGIRFGVKALDSTIKKNFQEVVITHPDLGGRISGNYIVTEMELTTAEIEEISTRGDVREVFETYNVFLREFNRVNKVEDNMRIIQAIRLNKKGEPLSGLVIYSEVTRESPGFIGCFLDRCTEIYEGGTVLNDDIIASNVRINIAEKKVRIGTNGFIGLISPAANYYFYKVVVGTAEVLYKDFCSLEITGPTTFEFFTATREESEEYLYKRTVETIDPHNLILLNCYTISEGIFNYESKNIPKKPIAAGKRAWDFLGIATVLGFYPDEFNLMTEDLGYLDENNEFQMCMYHDEEGRMHYTPKTLCSVNIKTLGVLEKRGMAYILTPNVNVLQPRTEEEIKNIIA